MGQVFDILSPELQKWMMRQKMFFVATAPLSAEGHVNCSPKGDDTFRVLDERNVAYADLTGSGIETAAHLQENGRIVIMFCAFDGPPKIVRLHGTGRVMYPGDEAFGKIHCHFREHIAVRAIIHVTVTRISDSCGHGVPLMNFIENRDLMYRWAEKKGVKGLQDYRGSKNQKSIDGNEGYRLSNHVSDPTSPSVTPPAGAGGAPSVAADH